MFAWREIGEAKERQRQVGGGNMGQVKKGASVSKRRVRCNEQYDQEENRVVQEGIQLKMNMHMC